LVMRLWVLAFVSCVVVCVSCANRKPVVSDFRRLTATELVALYGDDRLRPAASSELEGRGPDAAVAEQELSRLLSSPNWNVRVAATRGLGKVARDSEDAASAIAALLRREPRDTHVAQLVLGMAYETLAKMPGGELVTEVALDDLEHRQPAIRMLAAYYLGHKASRCPDTVISALVPLLDDSSDDVRRHAAMALGRFGARATTAEPRLSALLEDENTEVRNAARAALKRIKERR